MEQRRNIGPKYAIRLSDLRDWHLVTATCSRCRHQVELTAGFLAWERSPHVHLTDLERKLRCTRCGNLNDNTLSARMAPRD